MDFNPLDLLRKQAFGCNLRPAEPWARRDTVTALALSLGACLVYIAALRVGFFSDDYYFLGRTAPILEKPLFLFHIYFRDFIPVVHASFLFDWFVGGMTPWPYHLSSIVIHGTRGK